MRALRRPDPVRVESVPRAGGPAGTCAEADTTGPRFVVALSQPAVGFIVVRLQGELDMVTVPRARRTLIGAVDAVAAEGRRADGRDRPSPGRVACDLDDLDYVGAAGLGMLVEVTDHARGRCVDLVVVASSRRVRRVLDITGLAEVLTTWASRDGLAGPMQEVAS